MSDERLLGPASVRWNDYVGTAAADDADAITRTRSLYAVAGLDRDRWFIVSMDLEWRDETQSVTVYAYDRARVDASVADVAALIEQGSDIPVTAFHLDDRKQVEAFRAEAFKRMAVRLVASGVRDQRLSIDQHQRVGSSG
jgi:hypothetical protein